MVGSKWGFGLILLVLAFGSAKIVNAISCADALGALSPCTPFLLGNPALTPSVACCAGAQRLDKLAAASPRDRKDLCECLVTATKNFHVKPERIQSLSRLCHLTVKIPTDPNVDCSKF